MPFRDKYTNFWFNDISSETMKVWLTNSKDIEFKATPNFTDAFVNPVSSQIRYHTGTTFSSNDFQLKCIAIGVNMLEWRAIENWLSPLAKGKLQFEFNDNTYYDVKVSKQVKGTSFIAGTNHILNTDTYNIEFTVEFTTTSDWAALGPQVVVPINETYTEKNKVTMLLVNSPVAGVSTARFTYDYNTMTANPNNWAKLEWWTKGLDTTHEYTDEILAKLNGGSTTSKQMMECLKLSLQSHLIVTTSSAVNNKYGMPIIHNRSKSMNNIWPMSGSVTVKDTDRAGRKYITEPTLLVNKTIYLDEELFKNMEKPIAQGGGGISYSNYNYYLLDGSVTSDSVLTAELKYSSLRPNLVGYIRRQELSDGTVAMIVSNPSEHNIYGILGDATIGASGTTFYGLPIMFCASSDEAFKYCPFYYLEDDSTYAIMNAGSYEAYPDLYLDLGLTISTTVKKEKELLYNYNVSVQNTTLGVDGRTGFVTFNNLLADSATLTGDGGKTKVVESSTNNGVFSIPSGNPELLRVRVFGITHPKMKMSATAPAEDIEITQIYFQPVGEFKYSRNGKFAAMLFSSICREAVYDAGFYPLVNEKFVNAGVYGSKINDYIFSTNAFLSYNAVSSGINMWVLTMPTKDFVGCSLCDPTILDASTGALKTSQYMYLSLCDYTEASIETDTSMSSYIMMQTRDAY